MELGKIEDAKKSKPFIIGNFLWRRIPILIVVGFSLFFLLCLLLLPRVAPFYLATGSLLLKLDKNSSLEGTTDNSIQGDVSIFQKTLASRVSDDRILEEVLSKLSDLDKPTYVRGVKPNLAINILKAHLSATAVENTYLVGVALTGKSPQGLAPTLNAILSTLLEKLQDEQREQHALRLDFLSSEQASISSQLRGEQEGLLSIARNETITHLKERLALISAKLDDEELQSKALIPVVIDNFARTPELPSGSNFKKLFILAVVASFGMVGVACLLFDLFDRRIRCPLELGAAIGGSGAISIPATIPHGVDPDFCKAGTLSENHPAAVALRDLALRLVIEHERSGARIVSFVGLHSRSGNTSIALNVARAVAAHNLSVLLVELPTPFPGLASAANLPSATMTGESPWTHKIRDPSSSVDLIPWNFEDSIDKARFSLDSFLKNASKAYDLLLLDLVPISESYISLEASIKSSVVVITAAPDAATYDKAFDTVQWIKAGGVPAVTTVLNFVVPDQFRRRIIGLASVLLGIFTRVHGVFCDWYARLESRLIKTFSTSTHLQKKQGRFSPKPQQPRGDEK
jgi:capsular polysaccharide biosynthesis protein